MKNYKIESLNLSKVEQRFIELQGIKSISTAIPYITVDNFPKLGFLTALRFLEWVAENPEGTISLPTGKTPEYFIRWTQYLLDNWDNSKGEKLRNDYGLTVKKKPDLGGLKFVQIDEFYPINSQQQNSFFYYVNEYYIKGFGLNPKTALLINSDTIPLDKGKHFSEVFPDGVVDLSLRYREAKTKKEQLQQQSIFKIDDWCCNYETQIRNSGGIGFFLGGIGPDGHIAFNTRGSDHYSTSRLTSTNFETQAVAAGDLGGIEISRQRLVITIGLETITYNKDAVAIIFAAGEAKAGIVRDALQNEPSVLYPASVLKRLPKGRFYLTQGAASLLNDSIESYYKTGNWSLEKTERAIIDLCIKSNKYGHHLVMDDLKADPYCKLIPKLNNETVQQVMDSIKSKIERGLKDENKQVYYHTGPHHDDIMLGLLPTITTQLSQDDNESHFSVLTSGFTAVTNHFIYESLIDTKKFIEEGLIQMLEYPDFFESGYKYKWDKDVYHFLNKVASGEPQERKRGLSHRLVRAIVDVWGVKSKDELRDTINSILALLRESYSGQKNPPKIQKLKGMVREFEEELVWAHFGVQVKNVHHLRLGFYTGDIFTEQPNRERDVIPILNQLKEVKPTVISLAFDPEGSGPDTHYKVLQAIANAVSLWSKEEDLSNLRIWGYRNVWYKFHPADVNVITPVTLNSLDLLDKSFTDCYLSQVNASFPSYELDGKFSALAQLTWVNQLNMVQLLLGKDYFYTNPNSEIRASHGLLFFKEMKVEEFLKEARDLEKSMEGMI